MPAGLQGEIPWLLNELNRLMIFMSPSGHITGRLGRDPTIIEKLASYKVGRPPLCEKSTQLLACIAAKFEGLLRRGL